MDRKAWQTSTIMDTKELDKTWWLNHHHQVHATSQESCILYNLLGFVLKKPKKAHLKEVGGGGEEATCQNQIEAGFSNIREKKNVLGGGLLTFKN